MEPEKDRDPELQQCEEELLARSRNMGRLRNEYVHNLAKLQNCYHPKLDPHLLAIFVNQQLVLRLEDEIAWMELKLLKMEQKKANFYESIDLLGERERRTAPFSVRTEEVILNLHEVPKADLAVLRGYENPPNEVLNTVATVMMLRDESDYSWEESKVILSDTYFYGFFVSKCRAMLKADIDDAKYASLERYFLSPSADPEHVAKFSVPCGAISLWLKLLFDMNRIRRLIAPRPETLEELENRLFETRRRLQQRRDDIADANERLRELDEELKQRTKDLRDRYDQTMVPLQEMFFSAHGKFCATYESQKGGEQ